MRRVTFDGPELASFAWSGPAAHIKLVFPEPGSDVPPEVRPDGPRLTTMRTYTPRRFDPASPTLVVDFVLHGEGPGSTWAARARPGLELVLMGPGRGYQVDSDAAWYAIAGDGAALPAIETLLEAIPPTIPVSVFVEVPDSGEERPLPAAERADVRWLLRGDDAQRAGMPLLQALQQFAWPAGDGRLYVGCEAAAMRRIRQLALETSGLDRTRVVTRGYWRIGEVNHPDHDYGED